MDKLKRYFDQTPSANIPELQFLRKEEWLAASQLALDTENRFRSATSQLRGTAERVAGDAFRRALDKYKEINNGQFPSDLSQLKPYFERSKNRPDSDIAIENMDAIFQRWEIIPAAQVKSMVVGGDMVITQKAPVDDIFDERVVIGLQVLHRSFAIADTWDTMEPARAAYRAAHQGRNAGESAQLEPYVTTPEQKATLQRLVLREKPWE